MSNGQTPVGGAPADGTLWARLRRRFSGEGFVSHVLTLVTGTVVGQGATVLAAPLLSRIFAPEQFAVAALFLSATNLLYASACGRYELALMLPKDEDKAANVLALALALSVAATLLVTTVVLLFGRSILGFLGLPATEGWYLYLPLSVPLAAWVMLGRHWQARKKRFETVARSDMCYGVAGPYAQMWAFTLFWPARGVMLIGGQLIARLFAVCVLFRTLCADLWHHRTELSVGRMGAAAREYWRFPTCLGLSGIASFLAQELPSFLMVAYFGKEVLGLYYLGRRVLTVPMIFLGHAVGEVFFQRIAAAQTDRPRQRRLLLSVHLYLLLIVAVPMLVIFVWGGGIFAFVFGEKWRVAGHYASLLVPMLTAHFVVWPTRMLLMATQRQLVALIWFVIHLGLTVGSFWLGRLAGRPEAAILYYSLSSAVMYIIYAALAAHFLGRGLVAGPAKDADAAGPDSGEAEL